MALFTFIRGTEGPERRRVGSKQISRRQTATTAERDLHEDCYFLQLLYLERRRSERSSRPLCLILLEGTGIVDLADRETAFRQVFEQLRTSIRETDIIGWYKHNGTLAVLLSDLNSADKTVVNNVRTKVSDAVTLALTPDLVRHIRISVHLFPRNNDLGTGTPDLIFYPDLPYQYRAKKAGHVMKKLMA